METGKKITTDELRFLKKLNTNITNKTNYTNIKFSNKFLFVLFLPAGRQALIRVLFFCI